MTLDSSNSSTTIQNNGQESSQNTAKQRLDFIEGKLKEFESDNGLGAIVIPKVSDEYMNLTKEEMKALSVEDLYYGIYALNSLSAAIQKAENAEKSRISWVESELPHLLSKVVSNYKAYSYQERLHAAIKDNDYTDKLYQIKCWSQQRLDRLSYMSTRINGISNSLLEIAKSRKYYDNSRDA